MATRSRRSGAGDTPTLNHATIHLLDTGRLKKELEARGLSTTGTKNILSERLYEAVALGKTFDVTPEAPKPRAKKTPVVVKDEPVNEDEPSPGSNAEVERATTVEASVKTTPTKPKPARRKSGPTVKTEPAEEGASSEAADVKPSPKRKAKPRARHSPGAVPAKKAKKEVDVKKEPGVVAADSDDDEDMPLLSILPTKKKSMDTKQAVTSKKSGSDSYEDTDDDDVPLLEALGSKNTDEVVKQEPDDADPNSSHSHGTRSKRRSAGGAERPVLVTKKIYEEASLLQSDDFDFTPDEPSTSRSTKPREDGAKSSTQPVKVENHKEKKEREKFPSKPLNKDKKERRDKLHVHVKIPEAETITSKWKSMVDEMKNKNDQLSPIPTITTPTSAPISNKSVITIGEPPQAAKRSDEKKAGSISQPARKLPKPIQGNGVPVKNEGPDLLGSIIGIIDQSELSKRKRQEDERADAEEKARVERRKAEEARQATRGAASSSSSATSTPTGISSFVPTMKSKPSIPPPPPKKTPAAAIAPVKSPATIHLAPPPPPPNLPATTTNTSTSFSNLMDKLPPPPPPPKLPVPPPPPKKAPPVAVAQKQSPCAPLTGSIPPPPPKAPKNARPYTILGLNERTADQSSSGEAENINEAAAALSHDTKPRLSSSALHSPTIIDDKLDSVLEAAQKFLNEKRKLQEAEQRAAEEIKQCVECLIANIEDIRDDATEVIKKEDDEKKMSESDISASHQALVEKYADQDIPSCSGDSERRRELRRRMKVDDDDTEEYDPLATVDIDPNMTFEYVPSTVVTRNNTVDEDMEDADGIDDEEHMDSDVEMDDDFRVKQEDEDDTNDDEQTEDEKAPDAVSALLANPRDLLQRASAVLSKINLMDISSTEGEAREDGEPQLQYEQMVPGEEEFPAQEESEKPLPDFHGEPVPSDDDDMLFEIAAGMKPKKKSKAEIVVEEEKLPSDETIEPDYYNADLHIKSATDKKWIIEPENADGLALMWGGVKSNYGIRLPFRDVTQLETESQEEIKEEDVDSKEKTEKKGQKIAFQIKILEFMTTKHLPFEESDPHDVRIGFSLRTAANILGESMSSYCYTSLGKKATNNVFVDYGEPFHQNDIVTAVIDLEKGCISYWKNEASMGMSFKDIRLPDGDAIYPHICVKNCKVAVNFGDFPDGADEWVRRPEWRFPSELGRGDLERSSKAPESKSNCTVLMMVGLPGVGKTTWVRQYLRDHPAEQWTVINAEGVMAAMKVNGVSRKRAHQGRWDMVMGLIGKSLHRSILLAARRRRNYIIDMTNTSRDTRKKRLMLFEEFQRKCVVIIPSDEDMLDRQARQARADGTAMIPPEAMLEMKAVLSIPALDQEPLEEVYFIEPPVHRIQDAIEIVARYNEEARPWYQKKYKRRNRGGFGLGGGGGGGGGNNRDRDRDDGGRRNSYQAPAPLPVTLRVSITELGDVTTEESSNGVPQRTQMSGSNPSVASSTEPLTPTAQSSHSQPNMIQPSPIVPLSITMPPPTVPNMSMPPPHTPTPATQHTSPTFTQPPPSTVSPKLITPALFEESTQSSRQFKELPPSMIVPPITVQQSPALMVKVPPASESMENLAVQQTSPLQNMSVPPPNMAQPPPNLTPLVNTTMDMSRPPPVMQNSPIVPATVTNMVRLKIEDIPVEPVIAAEPVRYIRKDPAPPAPPAPPGLVEVKKTSIGTVVIPTKIEKTDVVKEAVLRAKVKANQIRKKELEQQQQQEQLQYDSLISSVPLGPQLPSPLARTHALGNISIDTSELEIRNALAINLSTPPPALPSPSGYVWQSGAPLPMGTPTAVHDMSMPPPGPVTPLSAPPPQQYMQGYSTPMAQPQDYYQNQQMLQAPYQQQQQEYYPNTTVQNMSMDWSAPPPMSIPPISVFGTMPPVTMAPPMVSPVSIPPPQQSMFNMPPPGMMQQPPTSEGYDGHGWAPAPEYDASTGQWIQRNAI